jgi:predicted patatin/cPLA2 family phospholipase
VAILRCPDQSAGTGVRPKAISLEVVLASACLPRLHDAVDIYGEPHWDGGYAATHLSFRWLGPRASLTCCWFS